MEKENESIAKTLEHQRLAEREALRDLEDLRTQLRLKEQEIERLKSRTDNASFYTKTLEQELSD